MFGVSHGALQFMAYEEMKNMYNQYRKLPIDTKLVSYNLNVFSDIVVVHQHIIFYLKKYLRYKHLNTNLSFNIQFFGIIYMYKCQNSEKIYV